MDASCLEYGVIISFVVSFLKRWPWAKNNPKVIAAVIASALSVWQVFGHGNAATAATITTLVQCVVVQLMTTIGTHEIVAQPITDWLTHRLLINVKP